MLERDSTSFFDISSIHPCLPANSGRPERFKDFRAISDESKLVLIGKYGSESGDRLAGTGGHLNPRPRMVALERVLQVGDGFDLVGVKNLGLNGRHGGDPPPQRRRLRVFGGGVQAAAFGVQTLHPGIERFRPDRFGQRFRPMDMGQVGGNRADSGVGVEAVDEAGLPLPVHCIWLFGGQPPKQALSVYLAAPSKRGLD